MSELKTRPTTASVSEFLARQGDAVRDWRQALWPSGLGIGVPALMIVLGIIGWVLNRFDFSPSPIVLGLVLARVTLAVNGSVPLALFTSRERSPSSPPAPTDPPPRTTSPRFSPPDQARQAPTPPVPPPSSLRHRSTR